MWYFTNLHGTTQPPARRSALLRQIASLMQTQRGKSIQSIGDLDLSSLL
jgi:hypothetical protein